MDDDDDNNDNNQVLDDLDVMFPPLDGLAMYSMACKMNHSCDPNVVVLYWTRGWGRLHPLVAYCVALRDIDQGEELCISYIAADQQSYQQRQATLANYGFQCNCNKCLTEQSQQLASSEDDGHDNNNNNNNINGNKDEEEEDNLFGDNDDDDKGDDDGVKNESNLEEGETDGKTKLQQRLEQLDTILNHSTFGSIPMEILAGASSFVLQTAAKARQNLATLDTHDIDYESSQFPSQLERCQVAVQQRDFVMAKLAGGNLERLLYYQLRKTKCWPSPAYREAYWCSTLAAAIGHAHECSFLMAQQFLDKALILGMPRKASSSTEPFLDYVEHHAYDMAHSPYRPAIDCIVTDYQLETDWKQCLSRAIEFPIDEINTSALQGFKESAWFSGLHGVVLRGAAATWPAVSTWRDLGWWVEHYGYRLVPIELGTISTGMTEALLTIRQFIQSYMVPSVQKGFWTLEDSSLPQNKVAYLAQHTLLDQMPGLWDDIDSNVPNLCGPNGPTHVNVWMGTGGTRTPLHFDSYDNWLVQLVGVKYVRVYPRNESNNLYVSKKSSYGLQGNMSSLDCELEDFETHPLAKAARYQEVVLLPGDCLFLPAGCWHYVRSLTTSISINFWF